MRFNNYTRDSILKAMDKLARPCKEQEVYLVWKRHTDIDKVKELECIKDMPGLSDDQAVLMAFRAAMVDMIEQKVVLHDKEGLLCLTEWMPDPKRMRSVDDEWTS